MPRRVGIASIVVGIIAVLTGFVVYGIVRYQLSAQKITVSSDAPFLAGKDVKGPFTAFAQAAAINQHALDAGNGKTYAELEKDDPARDTVMTADFLQASLYTSVVAFGMSILIAVLGVMFILVGYAMLELDKRTTLAVVD
jgi:xanthosine utilization system XapX-like protein